MSNIIKLKMAFSGLLWLLRLNSVRRMAKKYIRTPELVPDFERYRKILRLSKKVLKLYNIDITINGIDNLPKNGSVLLTPNHKSYTDVLAIIVALEKKEHQENIEQKIPTFVAKKDLEKGFLKNALKLLDSYSIDPNDFRNSFKVLNDFAEFVKKNKTYGVVFPEAHRIKTKELGEFTSGAFKIATQSYLPIVPVAIHGSLGSFKTNKKSRSKVTISFLPMLKANDIITQEPSAIAKRVKTLIENELSRLDAENINKG
ncbi:lysophospholipid acyltransferase family protein [Mycoplasmopsis cynos]|uniref:lysophospholipid acyltransferase family protein n=1 Tax=Mycoplasmopsis cynos TaxID=171284 RepID=UPI002AFF9DB3|nr:lysophospholipid acyltransferase family protein [Mycoplasmopsis cynos]WQQ17778.1 lysophospholipid acyltransferase family protein [Mycoplasmopsis cynos]WQQ18959.1 lysophospholipid acyltransferase family protein [Mycoplasmopsis cynos]